jgi:hypothetical protein
LQDFCAAGLVDDDAGHCLWDGRHGACLLVETWASTVRDVVYLLTRSDVVYNSSPVD